MNKAALHNPKLAANYPLIRALAVKHLKLRYKNSAFGWLWSLINPLVMLLVLIGIYSHVVKDPTLVHYPRYVVSGFVFWHLLTTSIAQMVTSIRENGHLLKSFPLEPMVFPLSVLLSNLMHFAITLTLFLVVLLFMHMPLGWESLYFFPALGIYLCFIFGIALTMASLNVYFMDIAMFWSIITPALFFATPIAYSTPAEVSTWMWFNPFAHFMNLFRDILYFHPTEHITLLKHLSVCALLAALALALGTFTYVRLRKGFISNY